MIKVAIVEDNDKSAVVLEKFIARFAEEKSVSLQTKRYHNALNFISETEFDYDIVLLDIEMPHMNGMEAAKYIRKNGSSAEIIFVTNMGSFAVQGYEVNALDFIVKPVSYQMFAKKFARGVSKIQASINNYVTLFLKEGLVKVCLDEVNYIEVKAHNILYHTNKEVLGVRSSMKQTEALLSGKGFSRCNNSYLVNLRNVYEIKKEMVKVGEEWLSISRTKKKAFMTALTLFLARGGVT